MEQVIEKLKSEIDQNPQDDWNRGWNAAVWVAIKAIEAAQQESEKNKMSNNETAWKVFEALQKAGAEIGNASVSIIERVLEEAALVHGNDR